MKEVVINKCHGGLRLSNKAIFTLAKKKGIVVYPYFIRFDFENISYEYFKKTEEEIFETPEYNLAFSFFTEDPKLETIRGKLGEESKLNEFTEWEYDLSKNRTDKDLIELIDELGNSVNGKGSMMKVVAIDDDEDFVVRDVFGEEFLIVGKNVYYVE